MNVFLAQFLNFFFKKQGQPVKKLGGLLSSQFHRHDLSERSLVQTENGGPNDLYYSLSVGKRSISQRLIRSAFIKKSGRHEHRVARRGAWITFVTLCRELIDGG